MIYVPRRDFTCPCCGFNLVQDRLVKQINEAAKMAGVRFTINSGYRCEKHNRKVKGSPTSSHLFGLACDIDTPNSRFRFLVVRSLLDASFNRIGVYKTFVHADLDTSKDEQVMWYGG